MPRLPLTPKDYDRMYHALGRPPSPYFGEDRNRYAVMVDSPEDHRIEAIAGRHGWWRFCRYASDKRLAVYEVTEAGRRALAAWMMKRGPGIPAKGKPHLTLQEKSVETAS